MNLISDLTLDDNSKWLHPMDNLVAAFMESEYLLWICQLKIYAVRTSLDDLLLSLKTEFAVVYTWKSNWKQYMLYLKK
jgi:hypothetical protein